MLRLPLALALALAVAAPASAQTVDISRDVAYGKARGADGELRTLAMDLYRPVGGRRTAPAIVWIHGGAFSHGSRERLAPHAAAFARRGYVAATIDYRLLGGYELGSRSRSRGVRAAQHDAQAAVRFLRRHAGRLGVDPDRIFAGGSSAGAVTALNVALHPGDPGRSGTPGPSSAVSGAIAIAGYATAAEIPAGAPPLLLLHGTADRTLPFGLAETTCELARRHGVLCDLVRFAGAGHRLAFDRTGAVVRRAARWLSAF